MAECNFMTKTLSCNFGCMLLDYSLIKSVILLAYILYYLKKYTSRGCAYFVVLGGMIFKSTSTSFIPKASSSTCSSLCPDQESQSICDFVDKCGFKTDRRNVFKCSLVIFPLTLPSKKTFGGHRFSISFDTRGLTFHLVLGGIYRVSANRPSIVIATSIVQLRHVITTLVFTVCFVVIHIALSILLEILTCIYSKISALRVASAVTSRASLHRFADKWHSPAHSEVNNSPVTKISYIYVCSKLAALAQIVACLPLVQQIQGSIPGGVVNFNLKIFNLGARRGGDVHFLIAKLYITGLD